jgi:hypothetical protein
MCSKVKRSRPPAALLALCLAAPSQAAWASSEATLVEPEADPAVEEAMGHFRQGIGLYEEGDYDSALFEFERAYELAPDYRLLYNVGVTQLETKDYAGAKRSLERYLDEGGAEIDAERRADVEGQLATLAARIGTVDVQCNVEGATVLVDGEPMGTTPLSEPLILNLGRRTIELQHEGHQPYREELTLTGGSNRVVEANLTSTLAVPPPVVAADDVPEPARDPKTRRLTIATWVGLGVTVAAGAGTIVTGVLALRADGEVDDELGRFPADPDAVDAAADRRDTLSLTTDVLVGVTAAFAVTTLGLGIATIVRKRKAERGTVSIAPGAVRVRF